VQHTYPQFFRGTLILRAAATLRHYGCRFWRDSHSRIHQTPFSGYGKEERGVRVRNGRKNGDVDKWGKERKTEVMSRFF